MEKWREGLLAGMSYGQSEKSSFLKKRSKKLLFLCRRDNSPILAAAARERL
jgi:hypothetical protein